MKDKVIQTLKWLFPYLIILVFSIFGTYLVFYKGVNHGDDYKFHIPNIIEQYETLLKTHSLSPISGTIGMGLGTGTRLFYSPLSHLTVTLLALFMRLYGGTIYMAYKTVLFMTVFISGIFMYRFAMHFTKKNKIASLIAAICFVIYPYRLFDAFCRFAFAEAYAIMFLPLFFMGLYDITHFDDTKEIKIIPFVEVILGGSLLFLTHNITAFYAYICAFIYLLFNIHRVIKLFKNKRYILYCAVSIFLLAGIGSIAFISQFELMATHIYNLDDKVRMWTSVDQVMHHAGNEFSYSGFLNVNFLAYRYSMESLFLGVVLYFLACGIFIVTDMALKEIKSLKNFSFLISGIVLFTLISLGGRRIEIYFGTIIFYVLYQYICYVINKCKKDNDNVLFENNSNILKNNMFWYSLLMIGVLIFMMDKPEVWDKLPSFLLNIQFPWRLWALVQIFVSILVGVICQHLKAKKVGLALIAIFVGLLMVTNEPLLEKRLNYEAKIEDQWHEEIDYSLLDSGVSLGFNKEYLPMVFFDRSYRSQYDNSLYYQVSARIPYDTDRYEDYCLKPVILKGAGKIVVNEAFSPKYDMDINAEKNDTLIQMPLIYYPGYKIVATNIETNEKIVLKGKDVLNVDGLIAFNLDIGKYKVCTEYIGTPLRKFSIAWFAISLTGTLGLLSYAIYIENKRRKKEHENQKSN